MKDLLPLYPGCALTEPLSIFIVSQLCDIALINPEARAPYHGEVDEMCTQLWEDSLRKPVFLCSYISPPRSKPRQHLVDGQVLTEVSRKVSSHVRFFPVTRSPQSMQIIPGHNVSINTLGQRKAAGERIFRAAHYNSKAFLSPEL